MPASVPTTAEFDALAARVSKLEAGVQPVPPDPPPEHPTSPEGTTITPGHGAIDDGTGHRWTVTPGGQMARDGAPDTSTSAVRQGGWFGAKIVQQNSALLCWSTAPIWPALWNPCPSPFPQPEKTTMRCQDFVAHIGINNHLGWDGFPYANTSVVKASMQHLGITLMRDAPPWSDEVAARYRQLADAGIRFNLVLCAAGQEVTQTVPNDLTRAKALGNSVISLEGPNECNGQHVLFHGASSADPNVAAQIQRYIHDAITADPPLAGKGLLNLSLTNGHQGWESYLAALGDLSGACDFGNWHVYYNGGSQPTANLTNMRKYAEQSAPGMPVIYTETGFFTAYQDQSGWGGCDEPTQAKNTLNLLASASKMGISTVFIYELLENKANPAPTDIEGTFGLFHSDGRPKPAADAIHRLTAILSDPGNGSPGAAPEPSFSGLPSTAQWHLLSKASGVYELLVWNEAPNWDLQNRRPITVPPVNVTMTLAKPVARIDIYDPVNGSNPVQSVASPSNNVRFPLADRMQIIQLTP